MEAQELANKAKRVFDLDTMSAPTIDLPIYYKGIVLASIRLSYSNGEWVGKLSDWEMHDIVECFENPQKFGITK